VNSVFTGPNYLQVALLTVDNVDAEVCP